MKTLKLVSAFLIILVVQGCCAGLLPTTTESTPAPKPASIGSVNRIEAQVEAGPLAGLEEVTSTRDLNNNDGVRVTAGGAARLNFGSQIEFKLFNDSELGEVSAEVTENTPRRVAMRLERGGLSGTIAEAGSSTEISVALGTKITVLGTSFLVLFDPETGYTTIVNFDGTVLVTLQSGEEFDLQPGQMLDVSSDNQFFFNEISFSIIEFDDRSLAERSPLVAMNTLRANYGIQFPGDRGKIPTEPLVVWHMLSGMYEEILVSTITSYSTNRLGVEYEVIRLESLEEFYARMEAGETADVIVWRHEEIGRLARDGLIVDLRLMGINDIFLLETFQPPAAASVVWERGIWGLPISERGIAFIYNRALLEKKYQPAGPYDLGGLVEKSKLYFGDKNQGEFASRYLFCNPGISYQPTAPAYFTAPIFFASDYPQIKIPGYIDEFGDDYLTSTSMETGSAWINGLIELTPGDANINTCLSLFLEEAVAALWSGPWDLEELRRYDIDLAILPMGRPYVATTAAMVTSAAQERGVEVAALELVRFLSAAEVGVQLAQTGTIIPANNNALKITKDRIILEFASALRDGVAIPPAPFIDLIWEPIDSAILSIIDGADPLNAMAQAQKVLQERIAEFR